MTAIIRRSLVAATFALAVASGTPAAAQMDFTAAVIGATMANMGSRQAQVCSPDTSGLIPVWGPKLDRLMEEYVVASAAGDARGMRKVFSKAENGGEWVSEGVIRSRAELAGSPASSSPKPLRVAVIFGGDSWTARGAWKIEAADGAPPTVYVADFRRTKGWGIWQIWRVRRYEATATPPLPEAFCTFEDQKITALW